MAWYTRSHDLIKKNTRRDDTGSALQYCCMINSLISSCMKSSESSTYTRAMTPRPWGATFNRWESPYYFLLHESGFVVSSELRTEIDEWLAGCHLIMSPGRVYKSNGGSDIFISRRKGDQKEEFLLRLRR